MEKTKLQSQKNKHINYLHQFGSQIREAQRESIRDAHSRVLEKRLENFYTRKSESALNHQLIMHSKKQTENERLKKTQNVKYQTSLAKIRMDST